MNKLSVEEQARVIGCLVEGLSLRSTVRLTGVHRTTIQKLLLRVGDAASKYQDETFRALQCKRVQCDEIWSFCYAKQKNVPMRLQSAFGYGDVWTWTAMCADSKLVFAWLVGNRDLDAACVFMEDVASRLASRVQLTTDGHRPYLTATANAFDYKVDYSMLQKIYGPDPNYPGRATRYSPAIVIGTKIIGICGNPDPQHISTSYAERQNLTMRMQMRRFTRLTNGFSKKLAHHEAAISLHFLWYNFARIHQTLRVTPAMAAGISDHVWALEEIANLMAD
jgi:IS1 family transposase